ncbi:hypothetical protein QJS83_09330 [Bdellovibrio sp. 22V]|uniref:hypothetical protein n=1 Tax=Bdellovibrio sp. 22V TaxID=3044166 RepID=UPI0025434213|nr:hypothetical protein [Bdellovibrio sp. 22V]WII70659.1 hypothetical protein QJS83_09330 [Bdellovibrio sp. 22V]
MIDDYGLYVQADGSNGDSAHRTGLASALYALLGARILATEIAQRIKKYLIVKPGVFRRSPYGDTWDTNPRCMSRDQTSRIILALAIVGEKSEIKAWLKQMLKRGFFHQNNLNDETGRWKFPDIMGLGEWSNVIRGLNWWWCYPLLIFFDINFIGMVYLRKKWDGVSLYVPDLKYALEKYWTPTAWIADKLNQRTPWLQEALENHSAKNNGCEELCDLFMRLRSEEILEEDIKPRSKRYNGIS